MCTAEHRRLVARKGLRYPSDLRDGEWALMEPDDPAGQAGWSTARGRRGVWPRHESVSEQAKRLSKASETSEVVPHGAPKKPCPSSGAPAYPQNQGSCWSRAPPDRTLLSAPADPWARRRLAGDDSDADAACLSPSPSGWRTVSSTFVAAAIAPLNNDRFTTTGMKAVTNSRLSKLIAGIMLLFRRHPAWSSVDDRRGLVVPRPEPASPARELVG